MAFGYYNNDLATQVKNSLFNTNNNTLNNYDSINNALINATKGYFNQKPKQSYLWEDESEYFPKHKFDKPIEPTLPNYILGQKIPDNIVQMYKQGGKISKYSDLSDKERYEVIRLGVQNGMTNLDDIEKAYNEYTEGGHVFEGYGNSSLKANFGQGFLPSTGMTIGQIKGLSHSVAETKRQEELKKAQLDYDRNKIEWNEIDDSTNPMDIIKYAGKRPETYADLQKKQKYEDDAKAFTKGALDIVTLPYSVAKSAPMLAKAAWGAYNAYGIGTGIYEGITEKDEQPQQSNVEIKDPYNNKDVKIPLRQDVQQTVIAKTNPSVTTKPTIIPTTDTRVKVRTPQNAPAQTTTQQLMQQQVTQQKQNKMQEFMNKFGSAAPYIGDFVGWTLGNSKFFNYGGNIYEIKG